MVSRAPELRPATQQAIGEKQTFGSKVSGSLRRLVETTSFRPGVLTSVLFKNSTLYFAKKDTTPQEPIKPQSQPSKNVPATKPDSLEGLEAAKTIEELAKTVKLPQVDTKPQTEQTEQKEKQG